MKKVVSYVLLMAFLICFIPCSFAGNSQNALSGKSFTDIKMPEFRQIELPKITYVPVLETINTSSGLPEKAYSEISMGDSGDHVRELQVMLNKLGYPTNGIDGNFGEGTYNAIIKFQSINGLEKTGSANATTQKLLRKLYKGADSTDDNNSGILIPSNQAANSQDYVLNMRSHKFHYPSCHSVSLMSPHNRWDYYGTRESIINMGYSPCGNCHP